MSFLNPEIPSALELNPLVSVDNSLSVNLGKNLIETESRSRSTALWSISSTLALEPLTASSLYLNQQVLPSVKQALQQFVLTDDFDSQLQIAFGEGCNVGMAKDLVENLTSSDDLPFTVQILPQSQLQGNGAFGKGTLFVSEDLLNSHRLDSAVNVVLEEIGHFIDAQVNPIDAPGDEGEIFANLVQQHSLDEMQLAILKTEDDHAFLRFNNELIAVEKALPAAGVFQVDSTGKLQIDFLADSGAYRSEMAVFSLEGMDSLQRGSAEFIKEAARRALTSSVLGYTVIIDLQEGAKFSGELGEKNLNDGSYGGAKIFSFNAGDQVAMMLVPQGTVQEIFNSPPGVNNKLPLFSLAVANPQSVNQLGQLVPGTFGWEDIRADQNTDADYNDIVFQVKGALGNLPDLGVLIASGRDWRNLELAKQITQFASQSVPTVQINLASDTGRLDSDRVTNNPEIVGSITNQAGNIEQLQASLNGGNFVDLAAQYQADASFRLTQATLAQINGGTLADGNYQLTLRATDQFGNNSGDVSFSFTLDTAAPQTPGFILNTLFDSAPIGDSQTTYSQINLLGQTEANALITLTGLGLTTTADSNGKFNFTNIALALGTNNLTVSSQDLAGNSSTFTATIQRNATDNGDVVLDWNATLLNAIYEDKTAPPLASRNMAMVQAAVFDTVNSFNNTYKNYHFAGLAPVNASIEAAA
ncbi:MAG: Ig-like domain-containing protein, partial [Snowella sp.]